MATVPTPTRSYPERKSSRSTPSTSKSPHVKQPVTDPASQTAATGSAWHLGTTWSQADNTTGFTQEVAQGYDAQSTQLNARRLANAMAHVSGYMIRKSDGIRWTMPMFVTSTNIDTSLAGSTAQSQLIQDFYPRNFVQPVISVSGWSLSQEDYGTLCEYVHDCQFNALSTAQRWASSMTQLVILGRTGFNNSKGGNPQTIREAPVGGRTSGRSVSVSYNNAQGPQNQKHVNQTIRGDHETLIAKGYVQSMPRIHQQFQYAVQWQFDFVVAQMIQGPFRESATIATNVAANGQGMAELMLADAQSDGLATVSTKQNAASLAYAASHAATLVGKTATGGSSSNSPSNSGGGSGTMWTVIASAESDGGTGSCRAIQPDGYSELSTDPTATAAWASDGGNGTAPPGSFVMLGGLPCLTPMIVTNPANGKSVTVVKQDVGAGSTFNGPPSGYPVMGLYPGTVAALGLGGSPFTVKIQRQDGVALSPVHGTAVTTPSGSGGAQGTPNGTSVPGNSWNPAGKPIANWIIPIITWAANNGWSGQVTSGYRTHAEQLQAATAYVASIGTTIAAEYPDGVYASNHCSFNYPGGAVDVTDSTTLNSVLSNYPNTPNLVWGGTTIEDAVHFSSDGH